MTAVYCALVHHPVRGRDGRVMTSAITNVDVHDIARSARTYGVRRVYIAHPVKALRALAAKIMEHWATGYGSTYNATRKDALSLVRLEHDMDGAILALERESGARPVIVATSAREGGRRTRFDHLRAELESSPAPHLIVLGTGWGLTPEVLDRADVLLEPICGPTDYNHLSVRSAAAVILDRLRGAR